MVPGSDSRDFRGNLALLVEIIDQAPMGICVMAPDGAVVDCNPAFVEMMGSKRERLIGFNILRDAVDRSIVPVLMRAVAGEQVATKMQYSATTGTRTGHYKGVVKPIMLEGAVSLVVILVEDVTEKTKAESALRESEEKYRALFESANDAIILLEGDRIIEGNSRACSLFDRSIEQLVGLTPFDLSPDRQGQLGESSRELGAEIIRKAYTGVSQNYEWTAVTPGGEVKDLEVSLNRVQIGSNLRLLAVIRNISRRKRSERLLESERRMLAAIAQGQPLNFVLSDLCKAIEESLPQSLCSVLLLEGESLRQGAAPSLPEAYNRAIDGMRIGPAVGSCGTAAYSREQVIVRDIETDPRWKEFRALALPHGLRSCWSTPVLSQDGTVLGTFAIYYRTPKEPSPSDLQLVERATHIASVAIKKDSAERALQESEKRLGLAFRGANLGYWDWNIRTGQVIVSERTLELAGLRPTSSPRTFADWLKVFHPDDAERVREHFKSYSDGVGDHFETEFRIRRTDGSEHWVQAGGRVFERESDGRALRAAGTVRDVTRRKITEEQLFRNAFYDPLTDLPNRALLLDRLGVCIARSRHYQNDRFAVLLIDIDRFKNINDGLGHLAGDLLIEQFGNRLRPLVQPADTVSRLGGDEFAILIDELSDESEAFRMAERIRRNLEETFVLDGRPIHVTASIGIVLGAGQYRTADEALRDADTAMFRAKAAGRDSYAIFDAQMHQHAINVLDLENALRRAIERQELRLHYQPIVSLATSEICGFEALIRWMHPERGLIPPAQFIPIAEETGLIVQIGRWVIREACAQLGAFSLVRPSPRLHMNVNLSARQIPQPGFLDSVRSTLKEFGTDPSLLRFEITESVLLDGAAAVLDVLHQLRNLGAGLVLDDFGTGYSSLGYLLKYPVQELKIDRSFVSDPEQPEVKAMIARTIVGLASNLGMKVTAEGVETLEQAEWLRKTGCDFAQGFLFSRPVPAEQAMELIAGSGYGPPCADPTN